ncbi:hypothetical protein GOODEAATRI_018234 [Goodea atripinnis]|uniref:Uncharacterized protein n=1 Tax=Goodea atripinnis TaxID=208336 RepID=A0ABV0MJ52_9TELE
MTGKTGTKLCTFSGKQRESGCCKRVCGHGCLPCVSLLPCDGLGNCSCCSFTNALQQDYESFTEHLLLRLHNFRKIDISLFLLRSRDQKYQYGKNCNGNARKSSQWKRGKSNHTWYLTRVLKNSIRKAKQ